MRKIELHDEEIIALDGFKRQGGGAVAAMKRIFAEAIAELGDIRNIDPKGNMGLQSLSRQEAVKMLEEVQKMIFDQQVPVMGMGRAPKGDELPRGSFR